MARRAPLVPMSHGKSRVDNRRGAPGQDFNQSQRFAFLLSAFGPLPAEAARQPPGPLGQNAGTGPTLTARGTPCDPEITLDYGSDCESG